jgi:hypothetical protein
MTKRKASHSQSANVPKEHPRAWNSALWDHVEAIRTLRRARKTWKEIGEHLEREHGLKLAHRTIRNFYVRYTRRLRSKTLPAGYEPDNEAAAPAPARPAAGAPPPPPTQAESFEAEYDRKLKAHQAKKQKRTGLKIIRPED